MSYVYFLYFEGLEAYKVGKTDNVASRLSDLKRDWQQISYSRSRILTVEDSKTAFNLESFLHKVLNKYKYVPDEQLTGYTEFFKVDIKNLMEAVSYAEAIFNIIDVKTPEVGGLKLYNAYNGKRTAYEKLKSPAYNYVVDMCAINKSLKSERETLINIIEFFGAEKVIKLYTACRAEICERGGITEKTFRNRLSELVKKGLLVHINNNRYMYNEDIFNEHFWKCRNGETKNLEITLNYSRSNSRIMSLNHPRSIPDD